MLAAACRSHPQHRFAHLVEIRQAGVKIRFLAADHDRQRARRRAAVPAGNRRIQYADLMLFSLLMKLHRQRRGGRRHIDRKGSWLGCFEDFSVNFFDVFRETDDCENQVRVLDGVGDSISDLRAFFL